MDLNWCKSSDTGLPRPDVVFYLSIEPEEAKERNNYGEERFETINFQKLVKANFEKLIDETWKILDAKEDMILLENKLLSFALETIENCKKTDIGLLWCD